MFLDGSDADRHLDRSDWSRHKLSWERRGEGEGKKERRVERRGAGWREVEEVGG